MIVAVLLSVLLETAPPPASIVVDLDGDGSPETVLASARGRKIRVEVKNAAGKRVARIDTPAPEAVSGIALTSGSLGSAGAILELSASGPRSQCVWLWRLRGRDLSGLAVLSPHGPLPNCSPPDGWTDRWEKTSPDAPVEYVREITRTSREGTLHRIDAYRFSGFQLEFDPGRSKAEIGSVTIPDWSEPILYPKTPLGSLFSCFDLTALKTAARLRIVTDRVEGVFAILVERPASGHTAVERRLPVTACVAGAESGQWTLTAGDGRFDVRVAADGHTPLEVNVQGLGAELDANYSAVTRLTSAGLELFGSAEDELALESLVGSWDDRRGERITIQVQSMAPAILHFGQEIVTLDIPDSPSGSDVLLVPRDGSLPRTALLLRGPDAFARVPVSCAPAVTPGPRTCRVGAVGELFRRLGSSMSAR